MMCVTVGLLDMHKILSALLAADTVMLLHADCTWFICTVHILFDLHRLHEAHKANTESLASAT